MVASALVLLRPVDRLEGDVQRTWEEAARTPYATIAAASKWTSISTTRTVFMAGPHSYSALRRGCLTRSRRSPCVGESGAGRSMECGASERRATGNLGLYVYSNPS